MRALLWKVSRVPSKLDDKMIALVIEKIGGMTFKISGVKSIVLF